MNKKNHYRARLQPVIQHLEQHYNQTLKLEDMAQKANISPYHFHRIFKAIMGEPLNQYVRRLKLEHAANQLFYQQHSVTEVAMDIGFSSSQALSKALNNYFGLSATQFKQCKDVTTFKALLKNSKIGHQLSNTKHGNDYGNTDNEYLNSIKALPMRIETLTEQALVALRVTGGYDVNDGRTEHAVQSLYQWAESQGIVRTDVTFIFIYLDNPQITPAHQCRTDVCITRPDNTTITTPFKAQTLPAGTYATKRITATNDTQFAQAWDSLIESIVESNWSLNNAPCFQHFHQYNRETQTADVSLYAAVSNG